MVAGLQPGRSDQPPVPAWASSSPALSRSRRPATSTTIWTQRSLRGRVDDRENRDCEM